MLKVHRLLATMLLIVGSALLALPQQTRAQANPVSLTGVVKSAAGEQMEGVTVSARAQGKTFTTSVFTGKDGQYFFPPLGAGSYKVWAQARGYDAGRAELAIDGSVHHQDFVLKETKDVALQLTGDQWIASLPEQTAEDRRMKAIVRTLCVDCHTPAFPLQNRFDEKGWERIITFMSLQTGVARGEVSNHVEEQAPHPILNYYKPRLAAYLAKFRGPESTGKLKLRPRPTGDATLAVITEYDTPMAGHEGYVDPSNGSDWSRGTPAVGAKEHHHLHDAVEDLTGNIWFTDTGTGHPIRSFAKVDVKTGKVTNFKISDPAGTPGSHGMTRDSKGFIWATLGSRPGGLVRIDPKTDKFESFKPDSAPGVGGFVRLDGQGRPWANAGSGIIMFDPETKKFATFKSPYDRFSPAGTTGGYGATGDAQGNGWWSQFSIDVVNKVNADTGKVESIQLPPIRPEIAALFTGDDRKVFDLTGANVPIGVAAPWRQGPRRPAADLHGDTVWVPIWFGSAVMSININTKAMKQYPLPTSDSGPYELVVDDNHNVWAGLQNSDTVAKLNPSTGKWTEYDLPSMGTETRAVGVITINGRTEVSLAEYRIGKVARLQFRTKEEVENLKNEVSRVAQSR